MLPMIALRLALGDLLAADVPTLAPVAANKIALIAADFVEDETLVLADLTLATFTGSAPKAGAAGAQQVGIDPLTGQQKISILPPAGGYRFECTVAPGTPEVIFGYALINNAGAVLLGVHRFDQQVSIAAVSDFVDVDPVQIAFVLSPMS